MNPAWPWEGVAIYTSGQNAQKKTPIIFKDFLEYYDTWEKEMYEESGFSVEVLVRKFWKQKLLDLIKGVKDTRSNKEFRSFFGRNYGMKLTYEEFNMPL